MSVSASKLLEFRLDDIIITSVCRQVLGMSYVHLDVTGNATRNCRLEQGDNDAPSDRLFLCVL